HLLRVLPPPAAAVADGLELVDELGMREQLGHRSERKPAEVLVEPRSDHTGAAVGKRRSSTPELVLEELGLVDADHLEPACVLDELGHAADGDRAHADAGMADD